MQQLQQIQGFLSDGVITQDEINQLPADSPFRQAFDSIAQNGQVTLQQLQQLHLFGPGPAMGPDGPWGHGPWGAPGAPGGPGGPGGATATAHGPNPQSSPARRARARN